MSRPIDHESLFEHAEFIRALAKRLTSDAHAADDLVQQTWVVALVQPSGSLRRWRGWLATVVRHGAWRSRRTRVRSERREARVARPEAVPSAAEIAARSELQRRIADAVDGLPEPYRSTVWLRYFEELSTAEIAAREGIAESSVRSRLSRAMAYLKTKLEALDPSSKRLLAVLAQPPLGLSGTELPAPPISLAGPLKIAAGLLVPLVPLVWIGTSLLADEPIDSHPLASAPIVEPEPPADSRPVPLAPEEESRSQDPAVEIGPDWESAPSPLSGVLRQSFRPPVSPNAVAGNAAATWTLPEEETIPEQEGGFSASVSKRLEVALRQYYASLDEQDYAGKAKALREIEQVLGDSAKRQRLDDGDLDAALRRTDWLVGPLNSFPKYPLWKRDRLERHEGSGGMSFWVHAPRDYSNREGSWPVLLVLRGPEDSDPEKWFAQFTGAHADLVEEVIVLISELPEKVEVGFWSSDEGIGRALQALGDLSWDQLRIDQDRMLLYGVGSTAPSALEIAARFAERFAGLALDRDVEPPAWTVNLEHLAILAPAGRLTDALAGLNVERAAHRTTPEDLRSWVTAARRTRFAEHVRGVFPDLSWGDRMWVKVRQADQVTDGMSLPSLEAKLDREHNAIHLTTSGIQKVFLRLNDEVLDLDEKITLFIDEQEPRAISIQRSLDELLKTAYYTGDRSRLFTRIVEVEIR